MNKQLLALGLLTILCIPITSHGQSLASYIAQYNPSQSQLIANQIIESGNKYHIDPLLLTAIYHTESRFDNSAVSEAGAMGISQLMPDTASEVGVNPYDIRQNIDGGAKYFRQMINANNNKGLSKYNYALASYNAGLGNTQQGIPSYTYDYINGIKDTYNTLINTIDNTSTSTMPINDSNRNKKEQLLKLYQLKKLKTLQAKR